MGKRQTGGPATPRLFAAWAAAHISSLSDSGVRRRARRCREDQPGELHRCGAAAGRARTRAQGPGMRSARFRQAQDGDRCVATASRDLSPAEGRGMFPDSIDVA